MVWPPYSLMAMSVFQPAAAKTAITLVSLAMFCPALGLITRQALLHFIETYTFPSTYVVVLHVTYHEERNCCVSVEDNCLPSVVDKGRYSLQQTTDNSPEHNQPRPSTAMPLAGL